MTNIDYTKLTDLELDGVDTRDYPDFCDAYITAGYLDGKELTEEQLDLLNEDQEFVYELVINQLF